VENDRETALHAVQSVRGPDGLRGGDFETVWVLPGACEKMLNGEAPPRAQAVRVILTELNRIASHLLGWARTRSISGR